MLWVHRESRLQRLDSVDPNRRATIARNEAVLAQSAEERLKGVSERRRALILKREAEEGVILDPLTGYPIGKFVAGDAPVEWLPDMAFWIALDRELIGARNENGFLIPSEVEAALDRWGIEDPENRDTAKLMLEQIAGGRNRAAMEEFEKGRSQSKPKGKEDPQQRNQ